MNSKITRTNSKICKVITKNSTMNSKNSTTNSTIQAWLKLLLPVSKWTHVSKNMLLNFANTKLILNFANTKLLLKLLNFANTQLLLTKWNLTKATSMHLNQHHLNVGTQFMFFAKLTSLQLHKN